jgi:hypothetical protein
VPVVTRGLIIPLLELEPAEEEVTVAEAGGNRKGELELEERGVSAPALSSSP